MMSSAQSMHGYASPGPGGDSPIPVSEPPWWATGAPAEGGVDDVDEEPEDPHFEQPSCYKGKMGHTFGRDFKRQHTPQASAHTVRHSMLEALLLRAPVIHVCVQANMFRDHK